MVFREKFKKLILPLLTALILSGCATTSSKAGGPRTEELVEKEVSIQDWKTNFSVEASKFNNANKGDVLTIKVVPEKSETYSVYFYNIQWKNYLFTQLECEPESRSITKDEGNGLFSRVKIEPSVSEYTITITLTDGDAALLSSEGLMLSGSGYVLKSIKYSYTKPEPLNKVPFEEQYARYEKKRQATYKQYSDYKLPFISITTFKRQDITKKEYYSSIVDVENCAEQYRLPQALEERAADVKVRGNSTSWETPYPYRIKFDKAQNLLGLNGGRKYKSWVLLKNWCACSDYLGFNLAHEIYKTSKFDYYASDCTPVHVFVNDSYKGIYLLCEQNQIAKGRVSVNENKEGSKDVKTGYMIELDNYSWEDRITWDPADSNYRLKSKQWKNGVPWKGKEDYHFDLDYTENGEHNYLTDINGESCPVYFYDKEADGFKIEYSNDSFTLKNDVYSNDQVCFISTYMQGVWDICYNAIEKGKICKFDSKYKVVDAGKTYASPKEACEAVIDLESLCNEIILEELVRDNDVGAGSLYMAVDFTVAPGQKYEKLTFECPWDFNWAYNPIERDGDGGKYWDDKLQYFACAWQSPYINEGEINGGTVYERSHPWFILFNNAPWFRKMLREKWEQINPENLKAVLEQVKKDSVTAVHDMGYDGFADCIGFVEKRIDYIDEYLWK